MSPFYVLDGQHQNFNVMLKAPEVFLNIITTTANIDWIAEINAELADKLKKTQELA